jgi:hypothetical protein
MGIYGHCLSWHVYFIYIVERYEIIPHYTKGMYNL